MPRARRWTLFGLILVNTAVELALTGADHGLWGSVLWRGLAFQYGGFWSGLLQNWQPNYALQPYAMFLTYSLLHAGFGHLLGNMLALAMLGEMGLARVDARRFVMLYMASALGGALVFGLLNHSPAQMVGASGAVFGLAGAMLIWDREERRATGLRNRTWAILAGLVVLNLVSWWMQAGNVAWQAHLGGFAVGAGLAAYPRLLPKIRS